MVHVNNLNIAQKGYHLLQVIHAKMPGEHAALNLADFELIQRNNKYALVLVNICTHFVFLEPLENKETKTICKTIIRLFCTIGFPKIIQATMAKNL